MDIALIMLLFGTFANIAGLVCGDKTMNIVGNIWLVGSMLIKV